MTTTVATKRFWTLQKHKNTKKPQQSNDPLCEIKKMLEKWICEHVVLTWTNNSKAGIITP